MKDLVGQGLKVADKVGDFVETGQERQATLTERHKNDMNSDNWLSKSIRPLSLLILLAVVCFIGIMSSFGFDADPVIMGELVVLLGSAFGFYFDSRKREKIALQNAKANVKVEQLKTRHQLKQEKKEARHERRLERRRERKQDKED